MAVKPGQEYCLAVRARDHAGNVTAWTAMRCTTAPVDDRTLAAGHGWSRVADGRAYRRTLTQTQVSQAALTLRGAKSRRLWLVADTCATCGRVAVFAGRRRVGTINLYSRTPRNRRILALPSFPYVTATVTIRVLSARKAVRIDALAVVR